MRVSTTSRRFFSIILFSHLYFSTANSQSLDAALRSNGATLFADHWQAFPPDPAVLDHPNLIIYALSNDAMLTSFQEHDIASLPRRQTPDADADASHNNAVKNEDLASSGEAFPPGIPSAEDVVYVQNNGTDPKNAVVREVNPSSIPTTAITSSILPTSTSNTTSNMTSISISTTTIATLLTRIPTPTSDQNDDFPRPPVKRQKSLEERPEPNSWLGKIYSGNGHVSYVIHDKISFDGGIIYIIDSMFKRPGNLSIAISESGLTFLDAALTKLPAVREHLETSKRITFLAPSEEAFAAAGYNLDTISDAELQAILDYHTITSGFIGYTPTFQNGKTYKTKSGLSFVVTFKGRDIYINDAKIISKNHIISHGCIQVLDKVLLPPAPDATVVPGPDGPVRISEDTAEDDDPMNPNPGKTPTPTTTPRTPPVQTNGADSLHQQMWVMAMVMALVVISWDFAC